MQVGRGEQSVLLHAALVSYQTALADNSDHI